MPSSLESAYAAWKAGGCSYRCALCGDDDGGTFGEALRFYYHLAAAHGLSREEYTRAGHGSGRVAERRIECKLCRKQVLHDYVKLRVHMDKHHGGRDLLEYFREHVYEEEEDDDGASVEVEPKKRRRKGGEKVDQETPTKKCKLEEGEASASTSSKIKLKSEPASPPSPAPPSVPRPKTKSDYDSWLRGCSYRCQFCHAAPAFTQARDLRAHLTSRHKAKVAGRDVKDLVWAGTLVRAYTR